MYTHTVAYVRNFQESVLLPRQSRLCHKGPYRNGQQGNAGTDLFALPITPASEFIVDSCHSPIDILWISRVGNLVATCHFDRVQRAQQDLPKT